jgi:hypothetical protein
VLQQELEAALLRGGGGPVAIGALQGMPGVGKSYLADRFAYVHGDRFPGGYVKLSLNPGFSGTTEVLGHLPLALHLAAGHLRDGGSVDGFLALLRTRGLAIELVDFDDPLRREGPKAVLSATFELSLDALGRAMGARAEAMLAGFAALGHAPPSGVGRSLGAATAGLDEVAFEELMVAAVRHSVAVRVPKERRRDGAWSVHPLLAELLRGGWSG